MTGGTANPEVNKKHDKNGYELGEENRRVLSRVKHAADAVIGKHVGRDLAGDMVCREEAEDVS
jgi:hypothetical protein